MTTVGKILEDLAPFGARLVAVSKTKSVAEIKGVYEAGHRMFGENRAQEMVEKQSFLPKDIEWHMIGHLQRKKVKSIAPFVSMIHSIDSVKLLQEVDKRAREHGRKISVLIQVKIAEEENKYGFLPAQMDDLFQQIEQLDLGHARIVGLMGMASFVSDREQISREFQLLKNVFDDSKRKWFAEDDSFCELSMGMSGDYMLALEAGSTLVRIGSLIFGAR